MRNEVTRANAVSERKKSIKKIASDGEAKKLSTTSPDVQFKKISWIKQKKTRPRAYNWKTISKLGSNKKVGLKGTMKGLGKPFRKKFYPKNIEKQ